MEREASLALAAQEQNAMNWLLYALYRLTRSHRFAYEPQNIFHRAYIRWQIWTY